MVGSETKGPHWRTIYVHVPCISGGGVDIKAGVIFIRFCCVASQIEFISMPHSSGIFHSHRQLLTLLPSQRSKGVENIYCSLSSLKCDQACYQKVQKHDCVPSKEAYHSRTVVGPLKIDVTTTPQARITQGLVRISYACVNV